MYFECHDIVSVLQRSVVTSEAVITTTFGTNNADKDVNMTAVGYQCCDDGELSDGMKHLIHYLCISYAREAA